MHRAIRSAGNKYIEEGIEYRNKKRHELSLATVKGRTDSSPPHTQLLTNMKSNPRKERLKEERIQEIELENKHLLHRMIRVLKRKGLSEIRPEHYEEHPHTMNASYRKKQQQEIGQENGRILRKLQNPNGYYEQTHWETEWKRSRQYFKMRCDRNVVLGKTHSPARGSELSHRPEWNADVMAPERERATTAMEPKSLLNRPVPRVTESAPTLNSSNQMPRLNLRNLTRLQNRTNKGFDQHSQADFLPPRSQSAIPMGSGFTYEEELFAEAERDIAEQARLAAAQAQASAEMMSNQQHEAVRESVQLPLIGSAEEDAALGITQVPDSEPIFDQTPSQLYYPSALPTKETRAVSANTALKTPRSAAVANNMGGNGANTGGATTTSNNGRSSPLIESFYDELRALKLEVGVRGEDKEEKNERENKRKIKLERHLQDFSPLGSSPTSLAGSIRKQSRKKPSKTVSLRSSSAVAGNRTPLPMSAH
eukprot:GILJ01004328.1.p1 GENE.GILJ01004328.1~~GILJ01004328.1.p1  ORF type:complete len:480 (-),score=84.36 GILJ01004328.1:150-1589(-)